MNIAVSGADLQSSAASTSRNQLLSQEPPAEDAAECPDASVEGTTPSLVMRAIQISVPGEYAGLKKRLRTLEGRAEAVKARERLEALTWARRAISEYGLTATDLGLRRG